MTLCLELRSLSLCNDRIEREYKPLGIQLGTDRRRYGLKDMLELGYGIQVSRRTVKKIRALKMVRTDSRVVSVGRWKSRTVRITPKGFEGGLTTDDSIYWPG